MGTCPPSKQITSEQFWMCKTRSGVPKRRFCPRCLQSCRALAIASNTRRSRHALPFGTFDGRWGTTLKYTHKHAATRNNDKATIARFVLLTMLFSISIAPKCSRRNVQTVLLWTLSGSCEDDDSLRAKLVRRTVWPCFASRKAGSEIDRHRTLRLRRISSKMCELFRNQVGLPNIVDWFLRHFVTPNRDQLRCCDRGGLRVR